MQKHVLISVISPEHRRRTAVALIELEREPVALSELVRAQSKNAYRAERLGALTFVDLVEVAHDRNLVFVMVAVILAQSPSIRTPRPPSQRAQPGGCPGVGIASV